jgi:hypothetical protein
MGASLDIAIYEPMYEPGQTVANRGFLPLTVEHNSPDWREFRILVDMYRAGVHRLSRLTGLASPKFELKTNVSGEQFIAFAAQGDADVYFINHAAHVSYSSFNCWMHGEHAHPGLQSVAQELLDAGGLDIQIADIGRHGADILCYSNYWVGTERFWDEYVGGILDPLASWLESNSDHPAALRSLDKTTHLQPMPYLPFITERLFTTFLGLRGTNAIAYPMKPEETCFDDFDREIVRSMRPIVDEAERRTQFPDSLKHVMAMLSRLRAQYVDAKYATTPHPHSGEVLKK